MILTGRKTTTRTHEGSRLLGVHIGVYKPSHLIAIDSTIDTIIH